MTETTTTDQRLETVREFVARHFGKRTAGAVGPGLTAAIGSHECAFTLSWEA